MESLLDEQARVRHSKKFIEFSRTMATHILSLPRNELRIVITVATGHGPMRHYLNKIGGRNGGTCEFEALDWDRLRLFGKPISKPEDILKGDPKNVLSFTKSL